MNSQSARAVLSVYRSHAVQTRGQLSRVRPDCIGLIYVYEFALLAV